MKNKGSILAITLGLSTIFVMFGGAALYLAGLQGEIQAGQVNSYEAFWLAEAGIQRGFIDAVPGFINVGETRTINYTIPYGVGNPTVVIGHPNSARWTLDSTGVVNGRSRRITAEVGANALRAITTTGTLRAPGGGGLDSHIDPDGSYLAGATFNFQDIFNITEAQMKALPGTQIINNPPNNPTMNDGINWINGDLKVTNNFWQHSGILIVDGDMDMQGGHFEGLIWVKGSFSTINGNQLVEGSIFVENINAKDTETKINGTSALIFDKAEVDEAYIELLNQGGSPSAVHFLSSWQEVS